MSRLVFFFFIYTLTISSRAQEYKPFIESNKYWDIMTTGTPEICIPTYLSYDRYFFLGDTTINDLNYSKLSFHPMIESPNAPPGCVLLGFSRDTFDVDHFFIREDTATQRVYRYDVYDESGEPLEEEILIYDFSLEVGDTLPDYCGGADLVITAIDFVSDKYGVERRAYHTDFFEEWNPLVEGLGIGSVFLWSIGGCLHPDGGESYCFYYDEGEQINPCFDFITIAENINPLNIKLYPNPIQGDLYFENLPSTASVEVYNMNGVLLQGEDGYGYARSIRCSQWSAGMLIVKILNEQGQIIYLDKILNMD